jgi:hypothetical protein
MPVIDGFIVAAIATLFSVFAAVLAWAEFQTRHLRLGVDHGLATLKIASQTGSVCPRRPRDDPQCRLFLATFGAEQVLQ